MGEKQDFERLPEWVPNYLACWGSKKPDGGRMTVSFAAEFAGTTPDAVRMLRSRSEQFQRSEWVARQGTAEWAQSYMEAGLRTMAPRAIKAMGRLLDADNPQTVLKVAEWLLAPTTQIEVGPPGSFAGFEEALGRIYGDDGDEDGGDEREGDETGDAAEDEEAGGPGVVSEGGV